MIYIYHEKEIANLEPYNVILSYQSNAFIQNLELFENEWLVTFIYNVLMIFSTVEQ